MRAGYKFDQRQIHIITTNRCNLRCSYCYEPKKLPQDADVTALKSRLTQEFACGEENTKYIVTFHGGEPLLAFHVIESITAWMWKNYGHHRIIVLISTNGTILNDNIRDWLIRNNKHVFLIVSIDGLPDVHNANRCGSFNQIDFDFLKAVYQKPFAKMTVPPAAISHMVEGFKYLISKGFETSMTIAAEAHYSDSDLQKLTEQLKLIAKFYKSHHDVRITEMLDFPFERMSSHFNLYMLHHRCGVGASRVAYDIHGNKYPCQTFITDFSRAYSPLEWNQVFKLLETPWYELISECNECEISRLCSPCYGLNHANRGNVASIDANFCKVQKLLVKAASFIWAYLLLNHSEYPWMKEFTEQERLMKLDGILNLQKLYASKKI